MHLGYGTLHSMHVCMYVHMYIPTVDSVQVSINGLREKVESKPLKRVLRIAKERGPRYILHTYAWSTGR
jgi:hypothetical protein